MEQVSKQDVKTNSGWAQGKREASRLIWAWDSGLMAVRAPEAVSSGEGLRLFLSLGFLSRFILGLGTGCAADGVMSHQSLRH